MKIFFFKKNAENEAGRLVPDLYSSNVNEVIRAVLNSLFFLFLKRFRTHQKHKDKTKQKHKTLKRTKIKNALKTSEGKKNNLFGYLHFCAFCTNKEKIIEKREKSPQCGCTEYRFPHN